MLGGAVKWLGSFPLIARFLGWVHQVLGYFSIGI